MALLNAASASVITWVDSLTGVNLVCLAESASAISFKDSAAADNNGPRMTPPSSYVP